MNDRYDTCHSGRERQAYSKKRDGALGATRRSVLRTTATVRLGAVVAAPASAATTWTVTSPDGETEVDVTLSDGDLSIAIHSDGTTLVQSSSIGITTASADFTTGLSFEAFLNSETCNPVFSFRT